MPDLSPVVCALDLAPESEPALVAAVELAARAGGPLHLVTVRQPPAPDAYWPPSDPEAATRAVVEVFVDRALGAGACAELAPTISVARDDDPAGAVAEYAERVGAGTLVLGTHARTGLDRFRKGSVAAEALRRAPCPVLVLPNKADARLPSESRPVLVPVDFSALSAGALAAGARLAALYGARVEALYVEDSLTRAALATAWSLGAAGFALGKPEAAPDEADLRAFARAAGLRDVGARVAEGDPAERIADAAASLDAGAVAMGTHGRKGLSNALFGSVAEATLRRVRCPVLTVRHAPPG